MLGISGIEFLVIIVIAIAVIPARDWPVAARAIGKFARWIRHAVGKIQDGIDDMENEIAKDFPVDNLSQKTMDDMIATFATPIPKRKSKKCKK